MRVKQAMKIVVLALGMSAAFAAMSQTKDPEPPTRPVDTPPPVVVK